jgi:hypothetical protein
VLVVGLFDPNGNCVKDLWKDVTLHPGDEELDWLRRSGIEIKTDCDVTPGRYVLRALVRDGKARPWEPKGPEFRFAPSPASRCEAALHQLLYWHFNAPSPFRAVSHRLSAHWERPHLHI